nr:MAG TPA: TraY domain [Caudoviricetes sp.]
MFRLDEVLYNRLGKFAKSRGVTRTAVITEFIKTLPEL